ncbi:MAG: hypothetical protein HC848_09700 [Limnobacter sp.]|nr:hypothetical protein [Limnobacter sp.]
MLTLRTATFATLLLASQTTLALDLPETPRPIDDFVASQKGGFTNNPNRQVITSATTLPPTFEAEVLFRSAGPFNGSFDGENMNAFETPVGFRSADSNAVLRQFYGR